MAKKKILILYNYILHYRKPVFNLLSEKYDVTILHSGKSSLKKSDSYKEIIFPVNKIGPFYLQKGVLKEVQKDYDIILSLFDVRWINSLIANFTYNKKAKLILWGAWITNNPIANQIRLFFTKRVDANVFYTVSAQNDFIKKGVASDNLFVANNTFDVGLRIKSYENNKKDNILFVGSLNKRKENNILIKAFSNILPKIPSNISLIIIGEGTEKQNLIKLVNDLNLKDRIKFYGKINDPVELKEYYKNAIVSVSFGQAGLSVLQSLGFGVPFITKENAISGGEKTNIKHGINGFFCKDNIDSLSESLLSLCLNPKIALVMGKNAFDYYTNYCTIENMTQGFLDAIENTRFSKLDIND